MVSIKVFLVITVINVYILGFLEYTVKDGGDTNDL